MRGGVVRVGDPRKSFPRRFVPPDAEMGRWEEIERVGQILLATQPDSVEALERWLEDVSELMACVTEERTRRYIAMTSQTDDPEREQAYLTFVREVEPKVKLLWHRLEEVYVQNPHRRSLPERYRLLDRKMENRVALFREENIPLEIQEAELKQRYQKITGGMTVIYRGEERTLQQIAKVLEDPDRSTRQEAWELITERWLQEREALEAIFEDLRKVRQQIAENAGFLTYMEYVFRRYERFDYTPEDCLRFHAVVENHVVPRVERLLRERQALLGVEALRPWDLDVDPLGRPPLRPFRQVRELLDSAEEVFRQIDPEFAAYFRFMREQGLLDLETRKGKAPGGYQSELSERRWPFIFMNAAGLDRDVRTLLHEAGHAMHTFLTREEPLLPYRHAPLEFAEVASMGMELLAAPYFHVFYPDPEDARRAYRYRLEEILLLLPVVAMVDAFQHWMYTHPDHTPEERKRAWGEIHSRFWPVVDWTGYEEARNFWWHRWRHIFLYPFYFIEYGIAQLGALQVWLRAREDYRDAVSRYREAFALGGRCTLPELFAAAGGRFSFEEEVVVPLLDALSAELETFR
ncbi:MAG: M3 family oligoendopeptidase [Armatimonadota bacterium]|nr:M3 family oligoendopeptidase [Armatimonadota bacterium]